MCSPSRASFLTGQPPQVTGVIDQMQYSFSESLSAEMPNMGSVLKGLGYRTGFFGKFEMDKSLLEPKPTVNYSTSLQPYGFEVASASGDVGSDPDSGFNNDAFIMRRSRALAARQFQRSAPDRQAVLHGREFRQSARHHVWEWQCPGPARGSEAGSALRRTPATPKLDV